MLCTTILTFTIRRENRKNAEIILIITLLYTALLYTTSTNTNQPRAAQHLYLPGYFIADPSRETLLHGGPRG